MARNLCRAVVLGAGTMGAQIAAVLANAGVHVWLLDIVSATITDDDRRREVTLTDPEVRNRAARSGLERARKMNPAAFTHPDRAELITLGNLEDDLRRVAESDWVIEAIVEDLAAKRSLLERVEEHWRHGVPVTTNTSGLPIHDIVEGRSDAFRAHFAGTHFFNPPRYLKLLEIIPTSQTDPEVVRWLADVADRVLGKSVVYAKDTPNFIANRIGTFGFLHAVRVMLEEGLTVEEVDELTGAFIGRPRSATFRTTDLVGLDVVEHVARNSFERLVEDEERETFRLPELLTRMLQQGLLGEKAGGGFYRRSDGEILTIDPQTMRYRPRQKPRLPAVEMVRNLDDLPRRIKSVLAARDRASRFLWRTLSANLVYAARRVPEVSDDIVNVDRALRWGFGWAAGPFETWDALGVRELAERLTAEGIALPPIVRQVLDEGEGTFYRRRNGAVEAWDVRSRNYAPAASMPGRIELGPRKAAGGLVARNPGASLVDLGDGVLNLELHSKMNTIGEDVVTMLARGLKELETKFDALVIGTEAPDFSVGANLVLLLMEAQEQNWEDLDFVVRTFQQLNMRLKFAPKPIVAALRGRTVAGGCEIALHAPRIQAAMETYMGLVETAVGLIPAGGGTKEMAARVSERIPEDVPADFYPIVRWAFENVALAKVGTSAEESARLGYLRECDGISMNPDRLLAEAKAVALTLVRTGYRPPLRRQLRVGGEPVRGALYAGLYNLLVGGHISEYDEFVARKLAYVITGGDVPARARVNEEHLLDLEREAFLSLLGERKTQERIKHMLDRGRPLRN